MQKIIDLNLNYWDVNEDINGLIKKEFYAARGYVFGLKFDEYQEEKSLPLNPKDQNIFEPLATYRIKDTEGNVKRINIFTRGLGGVLITDEF